MKHGCMADHAERGTALAVLPGAPPVNSELLSDPNAPARLQGMNSKKRPLRIGQTTVLVTPSVFPLGFALWVDGQLAALCADEERALRKGCKIALAKEADRAIEAIETGSLNDDGESVRGTDCALAFDVGRTPVTVVQSATGWDAACEDDLFRCADREAAITAGVAAAIRREIAIVFDG